MREGVEIIEYPRKQLMWLQESDRNILQQASQGAAVCLALRVNRWKGKKREERDECLF